MSYKDEYLAAANTNPELVIEHEPEPQIKWHINQEKLDWLLRGQFEQKEGRG